MNTAAILLSALFVSGCVSTVKYRAAIGARDAEIKACAKEMRWLAHDYEAHLDGCGKDLQRLRRMLVEQIPINDEIMKMAEQGKIRRAMKKRDALLRGREAELDGRR